MFVLSLVSHLTACGSAVRAWRSTAAAGQALQVIDAWQLGHRSDRDFDLSNLVLLERLFNGREVLTDRVLNILERFLLYSQSTL
jgi:hypothetical protein